MEIEIDRSVLEQVFNAAVKEFGYEDYFASLQKKDKSLIDVEEVQDAFGDGIYQMTPEEFFRLPIVQKLLDDREYGVYYTEFKDFVRYKFYELIGLDVSQFKEGGVYLLTHKTYVPGKPPAAVVFEDFLSDHTVYNLTLCEVFNLGDNTTSVAQISDLSVFDSKLYKKLLKEWRIKDCEETIKNLS